MLSSHSISIKITVQLSLFHIWTRENSCTHSKGKLKLFFLQLRFRELSHNMLIIWIETAASCKMFCIVDVVPLGFRRPSRFRSSETFSDEGTAGTGSFHHRRPRRQSYWKVAIHGFHMGTFLIFLCIHIWFIVALIFCLFLKWQSWTLLAIMGGDEVEGGRGRGTFTDVRLITCSDTFNSILENYNKLSVSNVNFFFRITVHLVVTSVEHLWWAPHGSLQLVTAWTDSHRE